jgi:hypothetical protein
MKDLISFCGECKRIGIPRDGQGEMWIGNEHPDYRTQLESHELHITYCPECAQLVIDRYKEIKAKFGTISA